MFHRSLRPGSLIMRSNGLLLVILLILLSCRSSFGQALSFFEQDCLNSHNNFRSLHSAFQAMTWNEEIAEGARNWSQFLLQNKSLLSEVDVLNSQNLGENLGFVFSLPEQAICSNSSETSCVRCSQVVSTWYNEISNYNFDTGSPIDPSEEWLHFTQVVWRSSTELGVGVASGGGYHYVVARYKPRGNLVGMFARNVPRLLSTEPPPTTTIPPPTTTGLPSPTTGLLSTTSMPAGLSFFEQDCLDSHNNFRSLHGGVRPLTWNNGIANGARTWAQFLLQNQTLENEVTVLNSQNLGENLGLLSFSPAQPICSNSLETSCVRCSDMVTIWYNEISNYNFDTGTVINSSQPWLNFTQVVWRSSTELGVGVASGGGSHYIVARYRTRGNVDGLFDRNVPRLLPTNPPSTTSPPDITTGLPDITTGPPDITTGPPDITTGPPDITTGPPDFTTGPPDFTTGPPDITTGPPDITTGLPDITTGSPDITTGPPDFTTGPPDFTTGPPDITTGPPDITAGPPDFTTGHPDITTGPPDITAGPPDMTTGPPDFTTGPRDFTTIPPDITTAPPDITTGPPDITTGPPDITTGLPDITTGPPDFTTGQPDFTTAQPDITTGQPDITTGQPDITTGPPDTTVVPPTTPPFCLSNRQPASQEEIANSVSLVILNITILEWCTMEENVTKTLAREAENFCNTTGACPMEPASSGVEIVILPDFPRVNSPLELRFFIRVQTTMNTSFTLPKQELIRILESFLRNISDTFGIEFTVNGNFTNWGPWGPCSASCAGGVQMRYRNCTDPPPINNGADCQGPRIETQQCNVQPCPVTTLPPSTAPDTTMSPNVTTSPNVTALPNVTTSPSTTNPPPCVLPMRRTPSQEEINNAITIIIINYTIPQWCLIEREFKQRLANFVTAFCNANIGSCANRSLPSDPDLINILPGFPIQNSPLQLRFYARLKAGRDQHVTIDSDELQTIFQAFARNLSDTFGVEFTADGNFTTWGPWGPCSASCAGGVQTRFRSCTNPPPINNGADCQGSRNDTQLCNIHLCPVDGNYTQWTNWSQCSATCDNGTQTRYRSCINPPPSNGGRDCVGPRNETQPCLIEPCTPRLYPFGAKVGDAQMSRSNAYRSLCLRINIPGQGLPFFIREHNRVYICRNGLLRFISANVINWPERFPGYRPGYFRFRRFYILAPYWSYISHFPFRLPDNRNGSKVYYQVYSKTFLGDVSSSHAREVFDRANSDVKRYQTTPRIPNFNASWALKVTWVRLYPNTYPIINAVNTFQIVLVTDGQHSFALFNYPENGIQWSSSIGQRSRLFSQRARGLPVIGYNAGDQAQLRFTNVPGAGTIEADTIDQRLGNTNRHGVWFFRLDNNTALDLPAKKCYTWSRQQGTIIAPEIRPCPCTFNQAVADKQFYVDYGQKIAWRSSQTICAYSLPSLVSRWAQQCCYTQVPGAGRVLTLGQPEGGSPFLIGVPGLPLISDVEAHQYCCNSSSLCGLYYQRRPSDDCSEYNTRRSALIWGDPHFITLDKKSFTFNGLGEYTMVAIDDGTFELQARTKRTSGRGLGTVFSAAAAKDTNTPAVEGRINSNDELEILVAGVKQNISNLSATGTLIPGAYITLIRDINDTITALFPSGISVTFASVSKTLAIAFDGPDVFKNRTRGLLGTWNDDPSDDFTTPDGTVLPGDASPKQIHYDFGLKWQIDSSQSLFTYEGQESPLTFMDLNYVPMFIDNITWTNDSFRQQAESVCGNNTNCLFDVAVTVDTSFGASTKQLEEDNNEMNNKLATFPPKIVGPQIINATMNETVEVIVTASHNSSSSFVFSVEYFPDIEIVTNTSQNLVIRWRPMSIQKVEPVFIVTDSNSSASELRPLVRLCPCQNGGNCVNDEEVQRQLDSGTRFILLSCECPAGHTGQFCESITDACVENNDPCFPGVECVNVPLDVNQTGYTCGPCPSGYHGDGAMCIDIDECTDHVSGCSQSCINTPGSYVCDCNPGYKMENDGVTCSDINECVDSNDCMQICTNLPGGRNCSCFDEFKVDPMDSTACIPIAPCNSSQAGCQQVCVEYHGHPTCSCYKGYLLLEDKKSCFDLNECTTHSHRCSQNCHNTEGGYTCSCDPGYVLDSDQMTCHDIDECGLIDVIYCDDPLELCINTLGSFHCECQEGFHWGSNGCEEIVPNTDGPSSTGNPTSVKIGHVPEDAINNAVAMTIRSTDLSEWEAGLSQSFKEIIGKVVEDYCQKENCYHSSVNKRSINSRSTTASVYLLKHFPRELQADLIVVFYVIVHSNEQENFIMTQDTLLQALKMSATAVSSKLLKEVYNIRAYHPDGGTPPQRESRMDTSQPKWIIIGVSLAVVVVMVIVAVVVCRRRRRISRQMEKHGSKSEFILRQWAGTPEETVFYGITNQSTKL